MSELTHQQMDELMPVYARLGSLANEAYALGREAGLKEAIAVCDKENVGLTGWRAELCAKAIRALIATPSDSPADVKSEPLCPRCHGQARTAMYRPSRGDYEMAPCIECSGTGRASPTNSAPQMDLTKPVPTKAGRASDRETATQENKS